MMRLLLDVSVCFCPTPEPLLLVQSTSLLLYFHLHCPSISSVAFVGFFSRWHSSVMLLLAAICFPFRNQFSLRSAILSTNVVSWHRIPRTVSFHILSRLVTLNNLLNHVISAVRIRLSSSLLKHQHNEPYSSTATTKVSYSFTLVSLEMLVDLHSLLNLFTNRRDYGCSNVQFCPQIVGFNPKFCIFWTKIFGQEWFFNHFWTAQHLPQRWWPKNV